MDAKYLEDRIAWARNLTARRIGRKTDAFRPKGPDYPLANANRYLRLHAAFSAVPGGFGQTAGYGNAICYGHFDAAYTRPGDYLVQDGRTVFIAAQDSLEPVMCVRTNRTLTIRRPVAPSGIGANTYGGVTPDGTITVARDWPASVLGISTSGASPIDLPVELSLSQWTVLLPFVGDVSFRAADVVVDDRGLRGTVVATEQTRLGWRMIVRQASA